MDLGSIMLILALALGVGIYISLPLTGRRATEKLITSTKSADDVDHKRSTLLAERDRVLTALQELDFDQALGKIPAEDYPEQRTALLTSGASVLRQLDEIEPANGNGSSPEDRIESAVAQRRGEIRRAASNGNDDFEMAIATRRRERQEKTAGFCPKCGKSVQSSDIFCAHCGTTL